MTGVIALPHLLTAIGQEARELLAEVQAIEQALLPVLLPALSTQAELSTTLQRIDPLLQRLGALARVADSAASEAPDLAMPTATASLGEQRLGSLLRALQPLAATPKTATLFDPMS